MIRDQHLQRALQSISMLTTIGVAALEEKPVISVPSLCLVTGVEWIPAILPTAVEATGAVTGAPSDT